MIRPGILLTDCEIEAHRLGFIRYSQLYRSRGVQDVYRQIQRAGNVRAWRKVDIEQCGPGDTILFLEEPQGSPLYMFAVEFYDDDAGTIWIPSVAAFGVIECK